MNFTIETEQEIDGRWIAEVVELPGVMGAAGDPPTPLVPLRQSIIKVWLVERLKAEAANKPLNGDAASGAH